MPHLEILGLGNFEFSGSPVSQFGDSKIINYLSAISCNNLALLR